ncbi:MAG: hypothetical protein WAU47_05715 [Desulfobaccales bacterium]
MTHNPENWDRAKRLLHKAGEESRIPLGLSEVIDRGPSIEYDVLMAGPTGKIQSGDIIRRKLTFKQAMEFLRGFRLGFALGSGKIQPGPEVSKFIRQEDEPDRTK